MVVTVRSSLRARLEATLFPGAGVEEIFDAVYAAIDAEIPSVLICLATIDPSSGLLTRALKSKPLEVGDHEFTAAEYGGPDVNQFAELALRPVPVGVLSIDTGGSPERCRRFREFMAPRFGFTDELRGVCRVGSTVWGAVALYRGGGDPPFSAQDGETVGEVLEVIGGALMRAVTAPEAVPAAPQDPTVLVLDEVGRIESRSGPVEALIAALGGWEAGQLPASLLAAAAAARTAGGAAASQIRTLGGTWVAVRAVPVTTLSGVRSTVLSIEAPPSAAIGRLRLAARGLTAREKEIVQQVLLGASTKEIALELHLSAHTVQDHLKAVFAKLGISSRRELIAQFVG